MTTGHILPGYGDPVTRLRRVQSVGCFPLDSSTLKELEKASRLSQEEFSQIKENARQLWSRQCTQETTYNTFFSDGSIREITQPRPTSSHRRHKPHSSQLFLTNKLHFIAGYHRPDTTVGKSTYKIDASLSPTSQERRLALRAKYEAKPDSKLTSLYRDTYGFKKVLPPREAQAAEAWIKLADDADRDRVIEAVKEQEKTKSLSNRTEQRPKSVHPSLYRWMRLSGAEENDNISRIMQTVDSDSPRTYRKCDNELQCVDGLSPAKKWDFGPRLQRGEYLIHPEWKTSLPHHRVP